MSLHRIQSSKQPCRISALRGYDYVIELLNGNDSRCFDCFRMKRITFIGFCEYLKSKTNLKSSRYLTIQEKVAIFLLPFRGQRYHLRDFRERRHRPRGREEKVAIFLLIILHNESNCIAAERFQHSSHTISLAFNLVLRKVSKLGGEIIRPPNMDTVPMEIVSNSKYYPFFKVMHCIGAIDGTHVAASILQNEQIPFRGRKTNTTWNIMCVCSFDMLFTFVMSGWEGSANDSRILQECIKNPENKFPIPNRDQYYLVDSGYSNMPKFLVPFRSQRYHLRDFRERRHRPRGREEVFNYRHSSLRNVIERCFGMLKTRFHLPPYLIKTQKYISIACCTVPNYIRLNDRQDMIFSMTLAMN
ncbi:hypothetical protein IC582_016433 [Cucumis melo]